MRSGLGGVPILVTGACGFLGAHVVAAGLRAGARVSAVDLAGAGAQRLDALGCGGVRVHEADLTRPEAWQERFDGERPELVVHCAGCIVRSLAAGAWQACCDANLRPLATLVDAVLGLAADERPVVVHPGSQLEYGSAAGPWSEDSVGEPVDAYGASKLAATELLRSAARAGALRAFTARFPILYGPGQAPGMFLPSLIASALRGHDFAMTTGTQRRQFVYVRDAAELLLELAWRLHRGEAIPALLNMPAPPPVPVLQVAEQTLALLGNPVRLEVGAVARRPHEAEETRLDDRRARALGLGNRTGLEQGLAETVQWYREHGALDGDAGR